MTRQRTIRGLAATLTLVVALAVGFVFSPWGERFLQDPRGQDPVVGATMIRVGDSWFEPPVSQVTTGTTVTFVWDDGGDDHNVVFTDGPASEVIATGTYQRTFTAAGSYDYTCTLHLFMDGRVLVVEP